MTLKRDQSNLMLKLNATKDAFGASAEYIKNINDYIDIFAKGDVMLDRKLNVDWSVVGGIKIDL